MKTQKIQKLLIELVVLLSILSMSICPVEGNSYRRFATDTLSYARAEVLEVQSEELTDSTLGTEQQLGQQRLLVKLFTGEEIELVNYLTETHNVLAEEGLSIIVCVDAPEHAAPYYTVYNYDRSVPLACLVIFFVLILALIGKRKGLDACLAIVFTLVFILRIVLPALYNGHSAMAMGLLITKSVSRFARNTVDCLDHVRMLRARGIGIYFEEQNIDTLQIDSELYLVIYAGFAQSESESISKNVTWTFRKRFQEGKPIFNYKCLLGYRKGADGEPEIVPEEASIVERIFNMYLSGETINRISTKLREENLQIPGKRFSFSASIIKGILRNERYCGDSILQKTVTIDCIGKVRRKNTGEAPMYYVQNSHVGIISREFFHKTQEELARRMSREPNSTKTATTATGKYSRYALSNVMICAECGSRYKRVTWTSRGKKRVVWRRISRLDYGKCYCKTSLTVDETALHAAIVRAINRFNEEDESTYMALMRATIGEATGLTGGTDEIDLLRRKIDGLNRKMVSLINESVESGEGIESHEAEFKELSDTIELLQGRIQKLEEALASDQVNDSRILQLQQIIADRASKKMEYDDTIVHQMIECVKVYPDGRLDIIFGGGYLIEERLEKEN